MELIIAEKPSVGRTIASVVGATESRDGYMEGRGMIVSWCIGHLVELAKPENYKQSYVHWSLPAWISNGRMQKTGSALMDFLHGRKRYPGGHPRYEKPVGL